MSNDKNELNALADKAAETFSGSSGSVKLVYILYLVGIVVPVISLIGLVLAYLKRGDAAGWVQGHYTFQIRTFWIGLLLALIAGLTMWIVIGWVVALAGLVWFVVRVVKGLLRANNNQAIEDPESWIFGDK